jgi:CRP/FNR family transcriptional regulator, cyclic AMP receptor protein
MSENCQKRKWRKPSLLCWGRKAADRTSLHPVCPVVDVPTNEFFFREHDQADSMFVLEAGKAAVLKSWGGQEYLFRILKDGDCFGEMAMMDLFPRSAYVRAVEDCTAIRLSAANLHQVYEQDLKQFALIQMNMGREVTRRLREADNQLFRATMGAGRGHRTRFPARDRALAAMFGLTGRT